MSDLVEQLTNEKLSENSLLHEVVISLSARDDSLVLCVEGWEDSLFYMHHVRTRKPGVAIDVIRCGNKRSALWLRDEIEKRGAVPNRLLFFVDRDLDEFVPPGADYSMDGLYCTDGYSFESALVGEQAFDVVWSDIFGLRLRGEVYEQWRSNYVDFLDEVARLLRLLGATAISARRDGVRAFLNEIDVKRRYALNVDGSMRVVGSVKDAAGKSLTVAALDRCGSVRKVLVELDEVDDQQLARGKNLFCASVYFFSVMRDALTAPESEIKCRRVPEFTPSHLLDSLSARLQCPESLHDFIEAA